MSAPMRRMGLRCCARAASGHAAAAPLSSVMNSRRFTCRKCIRSLTGRERIAGYRIAAEQSAGMRAVKQGVRFPRQRPTPVLEPRKWSGRCPGEARTRTASELGALSLGGLRRKVEALLSPDEVIVMLLLDKSA